MHCERVEANLGFSFCNISDREGVFPSPKNRGLEEGHGEHRKGRPHDDIVLRALPGWLFIITFCMTHAALSNHAVRAVSIRNAYAHVFIARSKTMPLREFCTESHPLSSQK